jgi:hypothetical protein
MRAYCLDGGKNRVLFVRDAVEVPIGEQLTDESALLKEYAVAAEKYFRDHPSMDLVVVEWREVKLAAGVPR